MKGKYKIKKEVNNLCCIFNFLLYGVKGNFVSIFLLFGLAPATTENVYQRASL